MDPIFLRSIFRQENLFDAKLKKVASCQQLTDCPCVVYLKFRDVPYVGNLKHRNCPCIVHCKCKDSPYIVYFRYRDCPHIKYLYHIKYIKQFRGKCLLFKFYAVLKEKIQTRWSWAVRRSANLSWLGL